ncbi:MAG: hypothetical protein J6M12_04920 [Clostridia bacterium]|nr:hypothetical protein [Clostridia bacterium]
MAERKRKKKKWEKEEVLDRLMRIAEEAHLATWNDKTDKAGNQTKEYDARCATIELKALEYAVKLAGFDLPEVEGVCVTLEEGAREFAK